MDKATAITAILDLADADFEDAVLTFIEVASNGQREAFREALKEDA